MIRYPESRIITPSRSSIFRTGVLASSRGTVLCKPHTKSRWLKKRKSAKIDFPSCGELETQNVSKDG